MVETEHPLFGTVRQLRSPVRVGDEEPTYRRAPARDEDAPYLLGEVLGYNAETIERLRSEGAFGVVVPAAGAR